MQATQMKYHSQAGKDFMGDAVYMMHLARTEEHFDLLASVALATLRCVCTTLRRQRNWLTACAACSARRT